MVRGLMSGASSLVVDKDLRRLELYQDECRMLSSLTFLSSRHLTCLPTLSTREL